MCVQLRRWWIYTGHRRHVCHDVCNIQKESSKTLENSFDHIRLSICSFWDTDVKFYTHSLLLEKLLICWNCRYQTTVAATQIYRSQSSSWMKKFLSDEISSGNLAWIISKATIQSLKKFFRSDHYKTRNWKRSVKPYIIKQLERVQWAVFIGINGALRTTSTMAFNAKIA